MSDIRIKCHPTLGILVGTDGHVMAPASGKHPARWTLGYDTGLGYFRIRIYNKLYMVHRLVAETFILNPQNKPFIDHIDRDRSNNKVENLRWATSAENNRNTEQSDRVSTRQGTHIYENETQYNREWYGRNREKRNRYSQKYLNTHKYVLFSDGSYHWLLLDNANELLKLPVKERVWKDQ